MLVIISLVIPPKNKEIATSANEAYQMVNSRVTANHSSTLKVQDNIAYEAVSVAKLQQLKEEERVYDICK